MVERCFQRLDERGIPAEVRILRALADTRPVATQGPVWYVGGKVVKVLRPATVRDRPLAAPGTAGHSPETRDRHWTEH